MLLDSWSTVKIQMKVAIWHWEIVVKGTLFHFIFLVKYVWCLLCVMICTLTVRTKNISHNLHTAECDYSIVLQASSSDKIGAAFICLFHFRWGAPLPSSISIRSPSFPHTHMLHFFLQSWPEHFSFPPFTDCLAYLRSMNWTKCNFKFLFWFYISYYFAIPHLALLLKDSSVLLIWPFLLDTLRQLQCELQSDFGEGVVPLLLPGYFV